MKKYYEGTLKQLTATNLHIEENRLSFEQKISTVKEEARFYKNYFGHYVDETGSPAISSDEVHDIVAWIYEQGKTECAINYLDLNTLKSLENISSKPKNKNENEKRFIKSLFNKN